jgi:putative transposase
MSIAVSSYRYCTRRSDESLREKLVRLAREKPRYGYRRLQVLVEREGERVNHKRLWRVYREACLCLKRKKRRHCVRVGSPRPARDACAGGHHRPARAATGDSLRQRSGVYESPFPGVGAGVEDRAAPHPAGKPTQNAHVESFHGRLREECLRVSWFMNLFDARRKVALWKAEYNEQRPHSSLSYRTPAEFARVALTQSYRKDVGSAHLENASGVSHFPTAPAAG